MDIRDLHIIEEAIFDMLKEQLFKDFEIDECMNFVRTRVYGKIKLSPTDCTTEIPFPTALNPLSTTSEVRMFGSRAKPKVDSAVDEAVVLDIAETC